VTSLLYDKLHLTLKHRSATVRLHSAMSQKAVIFSWSKHLHLSMPILVVNIKYPYNVITKIIYVKYISKARYKMNRSMNKTHTIQCFWIFWWRCCSFPFIFSYGILLILITTMEMINNLKYNSNLCKICY
jgi:hypothetical protein